jgi:caa(3)-type oxidase subunit IV
MKTKTPPRNILIGVWLVLMGLMLANFALSYFNLGAVDTAMSLVVAFSQMIIVLIFFMRLHAGSNIIRVVAGTGYFWLWIIFTLVLADYLTRQWH